MREPATPARAAARAYSGLACMALAVVLFSVMAVCVKALGKEIPAHEKILLRSLPTLALVLVLLRARGHSAREVLRPLPLLRGTFGALGMWMYFLSLAHLPLGNAVLLTNLSPLFAAAFAARFLGERVGRVLLLAALCCVFGVALIARPLPHAPVLFSALALLGAALNGGTYTLLRAGTRAHPPLVLVLALPLVATPFTLAASCVTWVWPDATQWWLIAAMTVTSIAAQVLMTLGMQREATGPATAMFFLGVVLALLFGQFLGDPALTAYDVAGGVLILAALAIVTLSRTRQGGAKLPPDPPPVAGPVAPLALR